MSDDNDAPVEDIPAWFMTYSDVITLLMTFFILLLTFATTEPEKYERVTASLMGSDSATGVAGLEHQSMDQDSWVKRVRPRAARIALQGSEMPPIVENTHTTGAGPGLKAPDEDQAAIDVMRTYSFSVPITRICNQNLVITDWATQLARRLSTQLRKIPVHCNIEAGNRETADVALRFAEQLMHVEMIRAGQIGIGFSPTVESGKIRFLLERYEVTSGKEKGAKT